MRAWSAAGPPTPRLPSSPGSAVPGQRPGVPHGLPQLHLLGRQVAVQESHRLLGQQGAAHRGGQARAPARADDLCTGGFRGRRAAAPQPTTRLGPQQRPAPAPARTPALPPQAQPQPSTSSSGPKRKCTSSTALGFSMCFCSLAWVEGTGRVWGPRSGPTPHGQLREMELQALPVGGGGVVSIPGRGASVWAWLQNGGVIYDWAWTPIVGVVYVMGVVSSEWAWFLTRAGLPVGCVPWTVGVASNVWAWPQAWAELNMLYGLSYMNFQHVGVVSNTAVVTDWGVASTREAVPLAWAWPPTEGRGLYGGRGSQWDVFPVCGRGLRHSCGF